MQSPCIIWFIGSFILGFFLFKHFTESMSSLVEYESIFIIHMMEDEASVSELNIPFGRL